MTIRRKARITSTAVSGTAILALLAACASPQGPSTANDDVVSQAVREAVEEEGPIVVVELNWTSQLIAAELATQVLEQMGAEVSNQTLDSATGWAAMSKADNMVTLELWPPLFQKQIEQYVEEEKSVDVLDDLGYATTEGWHVPTYVIEGDAERGIEPMCPDLPDWKALNECADIFATASTGSKGRYLSGDPAWGPNYGDQHRIDNLGLNYEMEFAGSEAALVAEIKRAFDRGEPLLFLMWSPHSVTAQYDVTMVEFPPYSDECWGTTYACGWDEDFNFGYTSAGLAESHPVAHEMLENFDLSLDSMHEIIAAVDNDGQSIEEAVTSWMSANESTWQSWIPTDAQAAQ